MTDGAYSLLLPGVDDTTRPYWDALRRHELALQACAECGELLHPPRSVCAACGSEQIVWRALAARATLYSFVVVHMPTLPQWRAAGPYNVALVALDDAPHLRLHGNIVEVDSAQLRIGMPLEAVFDDVTSDDTILRWRPATGHQPD